jgi:hypothetical protein
VPDATYAKVIRDPSGAQAGPLIVPPPAFQTCAAPLPSSLATYTEIGANLLVPPTNAKRPSGPHEASFA